MNYERQDMIYHDYQWTQREDDVQVKAIEAFRPENGNNVLNMINEMASNLFDGTILEIIIREFVPKTIDTVNKAYEWIKEKGDYYYKHVLRSIAMSE